MNAKQTGPRYGWLLLLGGMSLLPSSGCLTGTKTATDSGPVVAKSIELPPDAGAKACLTLAVALEKEGHLDAAINEYLRARNLDVHAKVSAKLAVLYDRAGKQQLALKEYQAALEQTPHDPDLLNNFGYFYYTWGKLPEAETKLREALALQPKHQHAWNNLGLVLGQQQRYPESLAAFQNVVSEADAHSNLAFLLSAQGKVSEAKLEYQRALQLEPNLLRARLSLDKLDHPGKTAPAPSATATAQKAARERLLAGSAALPEPPTTTNNPPPPQPLPPLPPIVVNRTSENRLAVEE